MQASVLPIHVLETVWNYFLRICCPCKEVLSVQASSVSCERIFSAAGLIFHVTGEECRIDYFVP